MYIGFVVFAILIAQSFQLSLKMRKERAERRPGLSAPHEIIELVERFDRYLENYKSGKYNETQVRREFVDPFFKPLGWDLDNVQGYAEAYK
jgi:hypothetical protein